MEAVVASVVAVFGTLLGSVVTHFFQSRAADRGERFARAERLRQERIDAYCAYAGALLDYRRVLVHRWFTLHEEDPCDEDSPALREEMYKTRYAAQEAMFRAQMVTDDPGLLARTEQVMAAVTELHRVADRDALDSVRTTTRQGIRDFIAATARQVH
ncbi:hypothetical protein ACF05W_09845 [Streptomyces lydicus]|uniref:hypothetical protein n=1 Tax=Streptomyces lydicus TaxID=47763 RepID=UPI0036FDB0B0